MSRIDNPRLTVSTDPMRNRATVSASCDIELTEFELNAIKLLDLQYTLECLVLNKDLQYEGTPLVYDPQTVPGELPVAHMLLEAEAVMSNLHQHVVTPDQLLAEFTLTNGETGAQEIVRSPVVTADLTA